MRDRKRQEMATSPDRPLGEVRFLTVAEVASSMRVSKMTVYRLVHSGTMPAVRVGRSFRVPEAAVSDYLRESFVEAG
jgi:excisionase family DNA binding protein